MKIAKAKALLAALEREPASVQLHHGELEHLVASCIDEIYELSLSGKNNDRKMKLVAIEYRGCGCCWSGSRSWGRIRLWTPQQRH